MYFEVGGLRPPSPPRLGLCPRPRICIRVQSCLKVPINSRVSSDESGAHKHLGTDIATNAIIFEKSKIRIEINHSLLLLALAK